MQILKEKKIRSLSWRSATVMASLLTLAACASAPLPPTQALQAAEQARVDAELAVARTKTEKAMAINAEADRARDDATLARIDASIAHNRAAVARADARAARSQAEAAGTATAQ